MLPDYQNGIGTLEARNLHEKTNSPAPKTRAEITAETDAQPAGTQVGSVYPHTLLSAKMRLL